MYPLYLRFGGGYLTCPPYRGGVAGGLLIKLVDIELVDGGLLGVGQWGTLRVPGNRLLGPVSSFPQLRSYGKVAAMAFCCAKLLVHFSLESFLVWKLWKLLLQSLITPQVMYRGLPVMCRGLPLREFDRFEEFASEVGRTHIT